MKYVISTVKLGEIKNDLKPGERLLMKFSRLKTFVLLANNVAMDQDGSLQLLILKLS